MAPDRKYTVGAPVSYPEKLEVYRELRAEGWYEEPSPAARVVLLSFSRSPDVKAAVRGYVAAHPELLRSSGASR
jgi:hypothetical protein